MNNYSFEEFTKQDFNGLSNWINKLNPYEFALSGVIAAFIIAQPLNANQQNSIGNYLEEVGQILLAIAAQKITASQAKNNKNNIDDNFDEINNGNNNNYNSEIEYLRNEIERLKSVKNYDDTFIMGAKRSHYNIYKKQCEVLVPLWLEQVKKSLIIYIKLKDASKDYVMEGWQQYLSREGNVCRQQLCSPYRK